MEVKKGNLCLIFKKKMYSERELEEYKEVINEKKADIHSNNGCLSNICVKGL